MRSFEARAGQILPRNALLSLIVELLRQRGHRGAPPLLVDGSESSLVVKQGLGTGVFTVSSLHIQQPYLWAAVAHECEHIRLSSAALKLEWHRPFLRWKTSIEKNTRGVCTLPPEPTFSRALEHLVDTSCSLKGRFTDWTIWTSVIRSVAEAIYDMALLDGPLLHLSLIHI